MGARCSRGTRAMGSTSCWATLGPGLAETPPLPGAPGWGQRAASSIGGDSPRHWEGSVGPRALPGLQGAGRKLGAGGKAMAPWPRPGCSSQPGRAPCPCAGQCTQQQLGDGGGQGSHRGCFALTFAPRSSCSGNLGTACPTLCKHPATPGDQNSDTGTRPWQRCSPMPCLGMTRHDAALCQGRCGGTTAADGCSCPLAQPRVPTGTAGCVIAAGLGCSAASPPAQPHI